MKKLLFIFSILLFFCSSAFSQVFVNHSYKKVESRLQHDFKNNKVIVTKTDSNLIYLLRDSTVRPLDTYFSFDKNNNCTFQKLSFDCDSCYHKSVKNVLAAKWLDWQSIAPQRYLSKYYEHLLLVIDDKRLFYTISLVHYTRYEYNKLLSKK